MPSAGGYGNVQPFLDSLAEEAEVDGAGRTVSPGLLDFLDDLREQVVPKSACVDSAFHSYNRVWCINDCMS